MDADPHDPFTTPLPLAEPPAPAAKPSRTHSPRASKAQAPASPPAAAADHAEDPPWTVDDPADGASEQVGETPTDTGRDLATIKTQLSTYDKIEAGLQDLEKRFKDVVYPVATPEGMAEAKQALKAIREPRFKLEHARKAAKAPILTLGRLIDNRAKTINTRLMALENPIDQQVVAQETIEAERIAEIQRVINWLRDLPETMVGKGLPELAACLQQLEQLDTGTFAEFEKEGLEALAAALRQVAALRQAAELAEQERQRQLQAEADRKRRELINQRIEAIASNVTMAALCRDIPRLEQLRGAVAATPITPEAFGEYQHSARTILAKTLEQLDAMLADRREREEMRAELEAVRAERERLRLQLAAKEAPPPTPPIEQQPAPATFPALGDVLTAAGPQNVAQAFRQHVEELASTPPVDPTTVATNFGVMPEGPTAEEIVEHLADHYDDHPLNVVMWLGAMDLEALEKKYRQPA